MDQHGEIASFLILRGAGREDFEGDENRDEDADGGDGFDDRDDVGMLKATMVWAWVFISMGTQPPKATIGAKMARVTWPSSRRQNLGKSCQNGMQRLALGTKRCEPT